MVTINEIFLFISTSLATVFKLINQIIFKISPGFGEVILLGLGILLSWLFFKQYEKGKIKAWVFWLINGVLIWLVFVGSNPK